MRGKGEVMIGCMEGARGEMRGREEGTRRLDSGTSTERRGEQRINAKEEGRGCSEGEGRRCTTTQPHTKGSSVKKKNVKFKHHLALGIREQGRVRVGATASPGSRARLCYHK